MAAGSAPLPGRPGAASGRLSLVLASPLASPLEMQPDALSFSPPPPSKGTVFPTTLAEASVSPSPRRMHISHGNPLSPPPHHEGNRSVGPRGCVFPPPGRVGMKPQKALSGPLLEASAVRVGAASASPLAPSVSSVGDLDDDLIRSDSPSRVWPLPKDGDTRPAFTRGARRPMVIPTPSSLSALRSHAADSCLAEEPGNGSAGDIDPGSPCSWGLPSSDDDFSPCWGLPSSDEFSSDPDWYPSDEPVVSGSPHRNKGGAGSSRSSPSRSSGAAAYLSLSRQPFPPPSKGGTFSTLSLSPSRSEGAAINSLSARQLPPFSGSEAADDSSPLPPSRSEGVAGSISPSRHPPPPSSSEGATGHSLSLGRGFPPPQREGAARHLSLPRRPPSPTGGKGDDISSPLPPSRSEGAAANLLSARQLPPPSRSEGVADTSSLPSSRSEGAADPSSPSRRLPPPSRSEGDARSPSLPPSRSEGAAINFLSVRQLPPPSRSEAADSSRSSPPPKE